MSEFGIKIKNYVAGSIYECNNGLRENYDSTDAMLTNSLFSDFLKENGMKIWKEESTRDIICIDFAYGSRSYDEVLRHLHSLANKTRTEYKLARSHNDRQMMTTVKNKRYKIQQLFSDVYKNQNEYNKVSREDLRTLFYTEGVNITYKTHNKNGQVISSETIHYQMLYRTAGKAKRGTCMFIRDSLYKKARKFLYMGIKLPENNAPLVEIGAYSSLITSTIVGKIQIPIENILVIKEQESSCITDVISIETNKLKECYAVKQDNYEVTNNVFDGQALIDSSIFPEWGNGYILLRHHMCKMAAFNTNIELFMRDKFGDDYETAVVKDMWGNDHYVKDIKLITTDSAMKWIKFGKPYEYWCKWVQKNNCEFGIVKTAHESKFGNVQRMSYQMVNALDETIMEDITLESLKYINRLHMDDNVFLEYLETHSNFVNDYEVLVALVRHNKHFVQSEYFRERKNYIIRTFIMNFKNGHIIQNGDNLTIVGNPYAMLLASIGEDINNDPTFTVEDGCIQCYTERFLPDSYLAEFRSPFNSKNNMGYLHNVYHPYFEKYFNLGKLCIAVNMIHTPFQDRNNGSDQDSDSLFVTDHPAIVACAKKCYNEYPTIVNNIPKESKQYKNTSHDFAEIDNRLAAAQLAIGESSNLAQICLTYTYNYPDQKYIDYVCILSVIAQAAIDSAKRSFNIDIPSEIARIKKNMELKEHGYPAFWQIIRPDFKAKQERINNKLKCPMNYLYNLKMDRYRSSSPTLPMSEFFVPVGAIKQNIRRSYKVEEFIEQFGIRVREFYIDADKIQSDSQWLLLHYDFDRFIQNVRQLYISRNYQHLMGWLLNRGLQITNAMKGQSRANQSKLRKNRPILIN